MQWLSVGGKNHAKDAMEDEEDSGRFDSGYGFDCTFAIALTGSKGRREDQVGYEGGFTGKDSPRH